MNGHIGNDGKRERREKLEKESLSGGALAVRRRLVGRWSETRRGGNGPMVVTREADGT